MNLILAADENWGIGYQGGLLTHLPGEMKYFRKMTLHKTIIMGRKTFESLPGGALKHRENIVLSRKEYQAEGVMVVHTPEELQQVLRGKAAEEIFVIGGGEIYRLMLPYAQKVYLTKIQATFPADTYFQDLDALPEWKLTEQSEIMRENDIAYTFCVYERV